MRGTVVDRDLLGALGEGPWGILFFFIARSASPRVRKRWL